MPPLPLVATWLPDLAVETQACLRVAYGLLLTGTLVAALPHGRRFFLSERWGGYAQSSTFTDLLHNPTAYPFVMTAWLASALLVTAGIGSPWSALVSVAISRYYFIDMRWRGVLRGMGAPGFMTYWLGTVVFVLEVTLRCAPQWRPLAVLAAQADLAAIMLIAGLAKVRAGYPRNEGMELGMANPEWGRWWKQWAMVAPGHWLFRTLNHLAWSTELVIGVLMLWPATRVWGALLLVVSFAFIATQIRLGWLCQTVMAGGLLFLGSGSAIERGVASAIAAIVPTSLVVHPGVASSPPIGLAIALPLTAYLVLLPFAYAGLCCNFYGRRALPGPVQAALDGYVNVFGFFLWRVFSPDITNFYISIYEQPRDGRPRRLVSDYTGLASRSVAGRAGAAGRRFSQVAESIAITTLFTALKYRPDEDRPFVDRLVRYARTLRCGADADLVFEYVSIRKAPDRFLHVPIAEFIVDPVSATVTHRAVAPAASVRTLHPASPVFEAARPGSYVPLAG